MSLKKLIKKASPKVFRKWRNERRLTNAVAQWRVAGCPVPPWHAVKQLAIIEFQKKYQAKILVETGTHLGDMVQAQLDYFDEIVSIELSERLWSDASRKFASYPNVKILQGDSGQLLSSIVAGLKQPAIFWLDGHYSGGVTARGEKSTPIVKELQEILSSTHRHVVLIDDARLFNGTDDYPTVDEIRHMFSVVDVSFRVEVHDDIIRCFLPK